MSPKELSEWFFVTFDEQTVHIRAEPPGGEPWSQEFAWDSVIRICLQTEALVSDGIYVFTTQRPESFVIPTEATGGDDFWAEILRRTLFDAQLAIQAMQSNGQFLCWPSTP
jgi:hypothetical protein